MTWPTEPSEGTTVTVNGIGYRYENGVWNRAGLGTSNNSIDSMTISNLVVTNTARLGSAGNVFINGSIPGYYLTGASGGGLAWIPPAAVAAISNGTSNIVSNVNSNIVINIAGVSNTVVFASSGVNVSGYANITGDITASNLSVSKITSNVSTGTAPLTVNSTTRVANLNVERANLSEYINVSRQTSGIYYPSLVSSNATGNYNLAVNPNIYFDISNTKLTTKNIDIIGNLVASDITSNNISVQQNIDLIAANVSLGDIATVKISGGSSGQLLRTDGVGNLSWTSVTLSNISSGNSNISVTSNSNVTISSGGNLGVLTVTPTGANITGYANINGNVTATGNLIVSNTITSNVLVSGVATGTAPLTVTSTTRVANLNTSRANISDHTSVTNTNSGNVYVTFANSNASGNYALQSNTAIYANLTSGNLYATNFIGNGSLLNSITGANITGTVALAATANSVAGANVTGTVALAATANSVAGANVTGTVASATTAGTVTIAAQPNITSIGSLTGVTVTGPTVVQQSQEVFRTISGATGVVAHDYSLGGTFYHTSVAGNFTANITNLNAASGRASILTLIVAQGATPYICNAVQIAGVSQTIHWYAATTPLATANRVEVIVFTIFNNSGTYTVLGQLASYG